ncbi:MAG: aminoacyl-histidine dipeptidase [Formivibrio sp.]|nr:aminoacyl-histidine dipeptidase [Formivibrio sp.]
MTLSELTPQSVWRNFAMLCEHPRSSGKELVLRDHLAVWAESRGLSTQLDSGGNLIIRKPATSGMEERVGVILQAHLDMVCLKNRDNPHDFTTDPIRPVVERGWVRAEGTTLGADNGMGVAVALAVLEATDIAHGPLEVLLTLDEEAGMSGARSLQPELLQGQLMFNLDTEDWGELYVGCAGGVNISVRRHISRDPASAAFVMREISVTGLKGGHSGCDIHLERANAIRLLARLLQNARKQTDLRLVSLRGGSLRNALPREAFAVVAVPACDENILDALALAAQDQYRLEYAKVDEGISVRINDQGTGTVVRAVDTQSVIDLLLALPHGVRRWSHVIPEVVETSNNLGVVKLEDDFEITLMVRSLTESGADELAMSIEACARLAEATAVRSGSYPGWVPDLSSRALQVAQGVYRAKFGLEPAIKVIHAGLECGLIGAKYPRVEMVSFGPVIRDAHSPDERVEIESVRHFWELLIGCLDAVPQV